MAGQDSSVYTETEIIFIPSDSVAGREYIKTIASISVLQIKGNSPVSRQQQRPPPQDKVRWYYVHIYSWHLVGYDSNLESADIRTSLLMLPASVSLENFIWIFFFYQRGVLNAAMLLDGIWRSQAWEFQLIFHLLWPVAVVLERR
jgi:hypothetical protein